MEEKRDYLVYDHFIVPVKLHYYGYTGNGIDTRKIKGGYKDTALQYYINQYGWDNISTTIVAEGLTINEAEQMEDQLIKEGWERGDCINKHRSGGEWKKDRRKCLQQYRKDHREELQNKAKEYYKDHREERQNKDKERYDKLMSTPEGKIYYRVKTFNKRHPDQIKETPLEAKQKYLQWGYIPDYIKSDDL